MLGNLDAQQLALVGKPLVGGDKPFDLANSMQNRGVIPSAHPSANFRQGARCQRFAKIGRHLPRSDDDRRSPRRKDVHDVDQVKLGDDPYDHINARI